METPTREELIGQVIGNRIANFLCHTKKFYKEHKTEIKTAGTVALGATVAVATGIVTV
jgi:hypothetical protein